MKDLKKDKKAQQEIAGFVLIVVLVTVIGMVFLGLYMYNPKEPKHESIEVQHLLEASMAYTTECALNHVPDYESLQDLIRQCYNDEYEACINGKTVCSVAKDTLKMIIGESFDVSEDSPYKAYKLRAYYVEKESNEPDEQDFIYLMEGEFFNCSRTIGGGHFMQRRSYSSGLIQIELNLCKSD